MDTNKNTFILCRRALFLLLICMLSYTLCYSQFSNQYSNPSSTQSSKREYTIKAGFIYKFLFFARWPERVTLQSDQKIIIGIMGHNPFGDIFRVLEGEYVENKPIVVRYFEPTASAEELRQCRILYIHSSLEPELETILGLLKKHPVLTVGEMAHFTYRGGMINFVINENRVDFEINKKAAEQVGIVFSSKLLRLAIHLIENNDSYQNGATRWEDTP